jgi:predicted secreted protein
MITATVLAIFFVPLFFVLVITLFGGGRNQDETDEEHRGDVVPT